MKNIVACMMAVILCLAMSACGNSAGNQGTINNAETSDKEQETVIEESSTNSSDESNSESVSVSESSQAEQKDEVTGSKILVIHFSATGTTTTLF